MLEKVRFSDYGSGVDVEAYTDGYAYDEYSCLYLLSVAGRDSNVKAITSAVVTGRSVEIMSEPVVDTQGAYRQRYRILSNRLPDALLHQIVADEGFFKSPDGTRNLLYVGAGDPAGIVYEAVRKAYPVPLIPEWSPWLYRTLRRQGHLNELQGTKQVLKLSLNEETLDSLISEAVSEGEISF